MDLPGPIEALPLWQIAAALRSGKLSAEDLACWAIENQATHSADAYRCFDAEKGLAQARAADSLLSLERDLGPLMGIPVSVKDLYGVPGFDTYAGTQKALPERFSQPGPLLQRLLGQLGLVFGKSHTVEFAFGGLGTNAHWPTPKNLRSADGHRLPGGSSSGAGVSLQEGSALLALGTDTAGSVRIPASMTGNVGLKLTKDRWSTEGIVPLSTTLDTPGILARSVEDLIYAFEALDPHRGIVPKGSLAGLRLGIPDSFFFDDCDLGVAERVEEAVCALCAEGAVLVEVKVAGVQELLELFKAGGPTAPELYHFLKTMLPEWLDSLDPNVQDRLRTAGELPAWKYLERLSIMRRLGAEASRVFEQIDFLVSPTCAGTPALVEALKVPEAYQRANFQALRNTSIVSCMGWCALSLPVGLDAQNMPVGMQLIGAAGTDLSLLAHARVVEEALSAEFCLPEVKKPMNSG